MFIYSVVFISAWHESSFCPVWSPLTIEDKPWKSKQSIVVYIFGSLKLPIFIVLTQNFAHLLDSLNHFYFWILSITFNLDIGNYLYWTLKCSHSCWVHLDWFLSGLVTRTQTQTRGGVVSREFIGGTQKQVVVRVAGASDKSEWGNGVRAPELLVRAVLAGRSGFRPRVRRSEVKTGKNELDTGLLIGVDFNDFNAGTGRSDWSL